MTIGMPESEDQAPVPMITALASRRLVLKASGMLAALIAAGGPAAMLEQSRSRAQSIGTSSTRSGEWAAAEQANDVQVASSGEFATVATDFPITGLGFHWDNAVGIWPVIEVRLSRDGVAYTDSFFLTYDWDTGKETVNDRLFTPMLQSGGAQYLQFRTLDDARNPAFVAGLVLTYIDASDGPEVEDLPSVGIASTDPAVPPRIISRTEWGADESLRFAGGTEIWPRVYETVAHAIVHHTETQNFQTPVTAMRNVYYYHAVTRGWGDIGYNYLVDYLGNVYEGRVGGQNVVAGHAWNYNTGSAGVSVLGDFRFQDMTASAQAGLVTILAWLVRYLDPLGFADFWQVANLPTICGHRDVNSTTCPGNFAYDDLPLIRQLVAEVLAVTPTGPPAGLVIGDIVIVATDDDGPLSLRSGAGTSFNMVAELVNGTVGTILAGPTLVENGYWYRLQTNQATGWAVADFLELAEPDAIAGALFSVGDTVAVNVASVSLFATPSTSSTVYYQVPRDRQLMVVNGPKFTQGITWYQLDDGPLNGPGAFGFANQNAFRLISSVPPGPPTPIVPGDVVETTTSLRLRNAPSTSALIITTMATGTLGTVLSGPVSGSGLLWYQIQTTAGVGYAAADYLKKSNQTPPPPPTPVPPKFAPGDRVQVTATLRLRSSPSTGASILSTMAPGTIGTVNSGPQSGDGYSWWNITVPAGVGWAADISLVKSASPPPDPPTSTTPPPDPPPPNPGARFQPGDTVSTTTSLRLRSSPSIAGTILTTMAGGTQGTVNSGPQMANGYEWWNITVGAVSGWAAGEFLTKISGSPTPPTYSQGDQVRTTDSLRLRAAPSVLGAIITTMAIGSVGTVNSGPVAADGYQWWNITVGGNTGWAAGAFLTRA